MFELPLAPYLALTVLGSAIWAFALAGAGWAAGSHYGTIHHDWRFVELAVAFALLLGGVYLLRRRLASVR